VIATPLEDWWLGGSAPLLVVQGLDDRVAVPENGRRLIAEIGDRGRLVELADASHALIFEQPDLVANAVLAFLHDQGSTEQVSPTM
jgi:pimeloyl-ACP methyl ester carboxylesterase